MTSCDIALKEWAVTLCALNQGRQIVLLRKGGLLDPATDASEAGTFSIEYSNFWLMPTFLHQDTRLVKPEHRDLFECAQALRRMDEKQFLALQTWARVEQVWSFSPDDEASLVRAPHIWSRDYLDVRFGYKPEHPLLCAALRVYQLPQPHFVPMQPQFAGCRSWLELEQHLSLEDARPVLNDEQWKQQLSAFEYSIGA
ncbi:MAG TPA: DUF1802 family protein [Abditibacteriaceae bacterium]|nr:DUF1802 family protein [Abditibacteriaceae bacterium]